MNARHHSPTCTALSRCCTRSFTLFTCCLLLLSALSIPAGAVVWIERHGISGTTLQSEFDLWTAAPFRYRMTKVSGSETSGAARYAVIFEQSTKTTPWAARNGMTAAEFTDYHNSIHPLGYRLVWLDGFGVGTTAYYNGIWEDTNGPAQRLRLGETLAAHQSADATNNNAGYYLTDVCSFSVNGSPFHAGVWGTARSGALEVKYSLTGAGYQTEFNNMGAAGYHLHRVCGYVSAGTDRYTGVWRTNSPGEGWSYHGMGASFFTAEMNNTQTTGYRPVFIDAWNNTAGDTVYNATWVRNGGLSTSRLGGISTAVSNYMNANNLPGLSLAIAREGRLVYARGFGYADTSAGEFAHSLHRWRIASTSKTIAAVSALRALEDSASWSLDSRAFGSGALFGTDFGTQAYSTWETQMTLRQMMNMTCGWQSQGRLWYESWPAYGINHGSIIGYQLDSVSVATEPGTRYCYNNTNYQVVARIPEKISGQTFAAYTAQEVFTPCGITSMALGGRTAADQLSNEVAYYPGDVYGSPETVWPSRMDGSTGWITKPSDLLLLARRIDGNARHTDIIGSYALSQMQLGNMQPDVHNGGTSGYGLGWYSSTRNGLTWWQHNGSMAGTQAILCVSGDGSQAFAYATNSVSNADAFSGTFRNTVLDLMDQINDANAWPAIDLSGKYNPAYDTWASSSFGASAVARTGVLPVWAPESDPDNDGRCNALEAYLGSNPNDPEASPFSVFVTGGKLVLRWRKNNGYRGVEVTPEWSSSMQTWLTSGTELVDRTDLITIIGTTIQEARIPAPAGVSKRYIRLSLSAP